MKIGTDAVLLGSWSTVGDAKRILDIGTGSGVLALMMAQRAHADSHVDAVELLPEDCVQAKMNILASPWSGKISVIHSSIQDFRPSESYDLVICNPPYFVKSLLSPDPGRTAVRHSGTLPHEDLIAAVRRLLGSGGTFHLILPTTESTAFQAEAANNGLYLRKLTRFYSRHGKPQQRALMTFEFTPGAPVQDSLFLYGADRRRTSEYVRLTGDFYLD